MKSNQVTVGNHYVIHHSGVNSIVKLVEIQKKDGIGIAPRRSYTRYRCLKLSTGREIMVKSAVKFRFEVVKEGEKWQAKSKPKSA